MSVHGRISMLFLASVVGNLPAALAGEDAGTARYVPWSGSFWPIGEGLLIRGPLTKYDRATGQRAAAWEYLKNPPSSRVPQWFGYCHAWASASVMDREPVQMRSDRAIDGRPIYLGIGDQKGMLTACHTADIAQHYGIRYTGAAWEDFQDIYPDQLWRVLKLYLKQQGIPLILDIEAGPEVWNYPVFAYHVFYGPAQRGDQYFGELSVLMSDDMVPPDCIGAKVCKETYYFTFRMQHGAVVLGSGRWVGPSVRNHPDFAWYPHTARSENPEIKYAHVKRLVNVSGSGPSASRTEANSRPQARQERGTSSANRPLAPAPWGRIAVPRSIGPNRSGGTHLPPNTMPEISTRATLGDADEPYVLSPVELLSLVTNQTSSFVLDVTVDKFDGGHYAIGEKLAIRGSSAKTGYLYLFYLDGDARLALMFPVGGVDNRIPGQQKFDLPIRGKIWRTFGAPGTHRVKAVVTTMPMIISGLTPTGGAAGEPQEFLLPPSHRSMFQEFLRRHQDNRPIAAEELGGATPKQFLGDFAQDEVAFFVGPDHPEEGGHVR